jgi:hypothetical protein
MKCVLHGFAKQGKSMIKKSMVKVGIAALLGGAVMASQAATMKLTGWTFGEGHNVAASAPVYSGQGGSFKGFLDTTTAIETYCLELTESFHFGTQYTNYTKMTAGSYFMSLGIDSKASTLAKLLSYANPIVQSAAVGDRDELSTALQLAIWNVRYDSDMTLTPSSNAVFSDTSSYAAQANIFLLGAENQSSILYSLHVLSSGKPVATFVGNQDQLIWEPAAGRGSGGSVPEPASLALALGALGALRFTSRRRQT